MCFLIEHHSASAPASSCTSESEQSVKRHGTGGGSGLSHSKRQDMRGHATQSMDTSMTAQGSQYEHSGKLGGRLDKNLVTFIFICIHLFSYLLSEKLVLIPIVCFFSPDTTSGDPLTNSYSYAYLF